MKGLKALSEIARQQPEQLDSFGPGTLGRLLGRHVRNLRSQVSRAACLVAGEVFGSQARCIDQVGNDEDEYGEGREIGRAFSVSRCLGHNFFELIFLYLPAPTLFRRIFPNPLPKCSLSTRNSTTSLGRCSTGQQTRTSSFGLTATRHSIVWSNILRQIKRSL